MSSSTFLLGRMMKMGLKWMEKLASYSYIRHKVSHDLMEFGDVKLLMGHTTGWN